MATPMKKSKTQVKLTENFDFSPERAQLTPWVDMAPPMAAHATGTAPPQPTREVSVVTSFLVEKIPFVTPLVRKHWLWYKRRLFSGIEEG